MSTLPPTVATAATPVAREIRACRSCASRDLTTVLDLGPAVLSDYLDPPDPDPPSVPLDLVWCEDCRLVQLRYSTSGDWLYRRQYWYLSGVNETMLAELAHVVQSARTRVPLTPDSIVVDIGANDGTLLREYPPAVTACAFEPALQFAHPLRAVADMVVSDFFPDGLRDAGLPRRSVDILTAVACFYDLNDPRAFIRAVDDLLSDRGVFIVQFQDLAGMVRSIGYDNVCHEHLLYLTIADLDTLCLGTDLHVTEVEQRAINGGSVRIYIRRRDQFPRPSAETERQAERAWIDRTALQHFAWHVKDAQTQFRTLVEQTLEQHHRVDLYAASTKSSVLLQTTGLGYQEIRCAAERSEAKFGKVTSGTRIPIVPEAEWRADPAAVTIIGAWGFADAFCQREVEYLEKGGQFIVPLPQVRVVRGGA